MNSSRRMRSVPVRMAQSSPLAMVGPAKVRRPDRSQRQFAVFGMQGGEL